MSVEVDRALAPARPRLSGAGEVRAEAGRARAAPVLWLARLLAVLLGLALPLIALEAAIRTFGPFLPGAYDTGAYLIRHAELGHFHVPGFDGWIKSSEFANHVKISPLGLRDRRTSYEKSPGTFRILLLGDSFTSGVQVQAHETLAERLEAALNRDAGTPVEVINAGVAGYSTGQQLLLLDQEGVKYQPDLVILNFFAGNDVSNNNFRLELQDADIRRALKPYFDLNPDGTLGFIPGPPPTPPSGLIHGLRTCCVVFNVVETGVYNKLEQEYPREQIEAIGGIDLPIRAVYDSRPEGEWLRGWKITELLLERLRDRAAQVGAPLVIVGIPDTLALQPEAWRQKMLASRVTAERVARGRVYPGAPNDRLGEIAQRLGVRYLDLLPVFEQAGPRSAEPLYYATDKHWTRAGHAVAAGAVERALNDWRLLDR
jgi:GDSL-like Lipase/Acylhydrolase family